MTHVHDTVPLDGATVSKISRRILVIEKWVAFDSAPALRIGAGPAAFKSSDDCSVLDDHAVVAMASKDSCRAQWRSMSSRDMLAPALEGQIL